MISGDVTEVVRQVVGDVLHRDDVTPESDFYLLGGDSLTALQVQQALLDRVGLMLRPDEILRSPVVGDFAARATAVESGPAFSSPGRTAAVSSLLQDRLLHIESKIPGSPFFTNLTRLQFKGGYQAHLILLALERLLARHDVLRSRITIASGAWQIEEPAGIELPVREFDLRQLTVEVAERQLRRLSRAELAKGFDLAKDGPVRAVLVYMPHDRLVLMLATHHVAFDGVSRGIVIDELCRDYEAMAENRWADTIDRPGRQYSEFAQAQREYFNDDLIAREVAWWRGELDLGDDDATGSAASEKPAVYISRNLPVRVSPGLTREIRQLGSAHRCSLYTVLLAGYSAIVASMSSQHRVYVSTLVANRRAAGVARCVGLFANTIVLRLEPRPGLSFASHVLAVRDRLLAAFEHEELPLEIILDYLERQGFRARGRMLNVGMALHGHQAPSRQVAGCVVDDLGTGNASGTDDLNPSTFGATWEMREATDGGLEGFLQCNVSRARVNEVGSLAERTVRLLARAVAEPGASLGSLAGCLGR